MSTPDKIFAWVGGISIAVLLVVGALAALAWSKDKLQERWKIYKRRKDYHGPITALRYTIGVRLLLPWMDRRYVELKRQLPAAEAYDEEHGYTNTSSSLRWTSAQMAAMLDIYHTQGGMTPKRHAAYWDTPIDPEKDDNE